MMTKASPNKFTVGLLAYQFVSVSVSKIYKVMDPKIAINESEDNSWQSSTRSETIEVG